MPYYDHSFWGMHLFWWIIWIILLIWILATAWDIPGQRTKKDTPLDFLKKGFARGELTRDEYEERKRYSNKINHQQKMK